MNVAKNFTLELSADQPRHVEVWCEASGMIPQLARVAKAEFGVPVCSASGFDGVGLKHDVVRAAINRGKPTVILQIGDHDASGVSIFDAFCDDIWAFYDDYGHPGIIEFRRVLVCPSIETLFRLERGLVKVDSDGCRRARRGPVPQDRPAVTIQA